MKLRFIGKICSVLSILASIHTTAAAAGDDKERVAYYRYINAEGVKVLSHTIPPEFTQKGYEMLSATGRVLKVVPPALTAEDIKAAEDKRLLLEEYAHLARRYSGAKDIEAAKIRQMERLEANIAITRGNINNLKRQIDDLTSKAADYERAAKPVPGNVLESLKKTREELATTENMMTIRQAEKQTVVDRFEREKVLFEQGAKLSQQMSPETAVPDAKVPPPTQ